LGCLLFVPAYAGTISTQTTPAGAAAIPALSGGSIVDFEPVALGRHTSLTVSGVTFTPEASAALYIGTDYAGYYNPSGTSLQNTYASDAFNTLTIAFASPVNAFGFLWGASDDPWTLSAYDASNNLLESLVLPVTEESNAGDFVGLTATGIASATLVSSTRGDYVFIDNFAFAGEHTDASVPEPSSFVLGGAGLLLVALSRRRMARA